MKKDWTDLCINLALKLQGQSSNIWFQFEALILATNLLSEKQWKCFLEYGSMTLVVFERLIAYIEMYVQNYE